MNIIIKKNLIFGEFPINKKRTKDPGNFNSNSFRDKLKNMFSEFLLDQPVRK